MKRQPRFILALDQGTTSSRAALFDRRGRVRAIAAREVPQHYPRPGWVEHDPLDLWNTQQACVGAVLARARIGAGEIAAVAIANQRETTVIWERDSGRPIHPAIVWQDRRTAAVCRRLEAEGAGPAVAGKTGLRLDPYFSGTKAAWILDRVPGARARAESGALCFGTVDTWLIWQLTRGRVHATDATNASRTLLFNLHTGDWDPDLLSLFRVPRAMLPEVRGCSERYGVVAEGLDPAGVPVAGVAGDQQAALFGQACFRPGMAKTTYGTGCFLLMNTGAQPVAARDGLLSTVAWRRGKETVYALEGSVFAGGAVVQWLRDELKLVRSARACDRLAASVPDAGGVFLVPAFTGLGAPHWDPYARGTVVGLTRGSGRAQLCRAAIEAIAFQTAEVIALMERHSGFALPELRVDGGAARSDPLLAFQSDLLGARVIRPANVETTAGGAAALAGLAVGFWRDTDEVASRWRPDRVFEPGRPPGEVRALRADWARAVERARGWAREDTEANGAAEEA